MSDDVATPVPAAAPAERTVSLRQLLLVPAILVPLISTVPVAARKASEPAAAVSLAPPPPDEFGTMSGEPGLPPVTIPPPPGKPPKPPKPAREPPPPPEPAPPPK